MEMAVESMEMAPGAITRPGRVPEQRLLSPESCFGVDGGVGTFRGLRPIDLGFLQDGEYMGEEAESAEARGAHTMPRRGPRVGRA